ncbi:branched-chain amino acid ABC transporter permease [Gordonia amarae]|uniref:Branched-chain amino acid ABC transporter permease n=2 Tax=Gordonia amarae TaxID=36821 RepID=A0A857KLD0_9ACTN|nr:branched-chain amino acid ABC transporter permease [Gordonia amarae]MCS3879461.1 branched-chain amino acid transport system permease protein [Gordonia amarae]QHN17925.1 branched-chain amino acid ABC transporter permease [Gordonia amarae]QHN22447.1 branched-chain amino acid ABC transporter permease [Gordonia amarae]QHN31323.1 branched-chain amino acid ABC transporter permease [Gordonia amarae]QHN40068.1 branched-chain amino acid ABC transporter permease [Gordonia amarae]
MTTPDPAVPAADQAPRRGIGDAIRTWWDRQSRPAQWGIGIIAFVLLALLPVLDPPLISTTATNFGATMAQFAMVALIAIGLNVVVGQTGLLDLGYVGFYAVGAYVVALLTSPASPIWDSSDHGLFSGPWAWIACIPLAIVITGITGVILGTPTLRVRGDYLAIVTLGFGEIVRLLADNLKEVTNGPAGLEGILFPELGTSGDNPDGVFSTQNNSGTLSYGIWWYWLALLLVVIVLLFVGNLERSRVGRSWIAIREDEDAAEIMGVPTFKYKLWAFVIGAGIGGLSGAVYAGQVQYVDPKAFTVINSMLFLCAVVIGGQGNKLGVIVGAFVIVYLPARVQGIEVGGQSLGDFKYLFFGLALVALMIFRPQGLFPARARLITFGRQVYAAAQRVGDVIRREPGPASGQKEITS